MNGTIKKTTLLNNSLIWFGAAVSIAEIMTGTLLAPLGFIKGTTAIILGHLIGCTLMYFAGIIGAKTGRSAMETVKISFGNKGFLFFAILNILQLVGWTAVMIIGGARAAGVILNPFLNINGEGLWCLVISALIVIWILVGIENLSKINIFAMSCLFLSTLALSFIVFQGGMTSSPSEGISFGAAVELSAAMPLSWLPLISDYTRSARRPETATKVSVSAYFLTSCWMYVIGLGTAIFTGESDIAIIMVKAGLGFLGVIIVIFSTVTTTFLDVYSASVSSSAIMQKINQKWIAIVVCVIGTILAIFTPIEQYQNFLYLIGSVFAPMIALLITDYFILKKDYTQNPFSVTNSVLWIIGFMVYRYFISLDTILGSTLPVMIIISILSILINGGKSYVQKNSGKR